MPVNTTINPKSACQLDEATLIQVVDVDNLFLDEIDLYAQDTNALHNQLYNLSEYELKRQFLGYLLKTLNECQPRAGKRWMRVFKRMYKLYLTEFKTKTDQDKQKQIKSFLED